jgi:protein OPY2
MALDSSATRLFRRCVQCPPDPPVCPACGVDETCSLTAESCNSCASTTCVKIGSLPGQAAPKKSSSAGPIAGGVIGGVIALAVIAYLVYRFYFKKRRQVPAWDPPEKRDQSTLSRSNHQSTHSIASTVLTRASNVIQIAYIPGVTVRSPPESPGLHVPPVPAIPGAHGNSATSSPQLEQHFFMPRDLRDSTWSDASSIDTRFSIAPSLARQSVATTIFRSDGIVPPVPAVQAFRAQANVVSVNKSGSTTPGTLNTPNSRTPQIPQGPLGTSGSSIVARNVTARPIEVKKVGSGTKVPTLGNLAKEAARKSSVATTGKDSIGKESVQVFVDEKEVVASPTSTTPGTLHETPISPLVIPRQPFAANHSARSSSVSGIQDMSKGSASSGPTHRHTNSHTLSALIEDSINRARDPQHMNVSSPVLRPELVKHDSGDSGPFSDANEVKENLS